ncbi:hypothetical protein KIS1582_4026 [Cytobacillus firmus]|uniref:Uncharacterized protein n=1 Tax=Cytobacillus firmus TaxID=1399 RepID=A0A800N8T4_CYTFI|nr:hypothetical protein KIS1582_4026 [Cytobacillus firmus]
MVKKLRIKWHKFWFLTYNTILGATSSTTLFINIYKKSKYHHTKLIQYL